MDFKVNTKNKLDYFMKVINVLSLVGPVDKLRPKERELLAHFLYYNDKYKSLGIDERIKLLNDKGTRIDISEEMNIDSQTFYNLKSQLKIKKLLVDNYLSKSFVSLLHKNNFNINFIFTDV